jgi:hypothetical protein
MAFDTMNLIVQLPEDNLQFAGFWQSPSAPECVAAVFPNDDYSPPGLPGTDAGNLCPDESPGPCTFTEAPVTPIGEATPRSSVCTADDVQNETCGLPLNPAEQCTRIDGCWTTPGLVVSGVCLLD